MGHSVWNKAMAARVAAFLVGVLGLASLRATYDAALPADLMPQLWALAGFYAVVTVFGVTAALLAVARGWRIGAAPAGGLVVAVSMTVLGGGVDWPRLALHGLMPLAVGLWWLVFAPKGVQRRDLAVWLIWPVVYGTYALLRGQITGDWPCPALDVGSLGLLRVARNALALLVGFWLVGQAVQFVARRLR
ncbi:MAG: Pr6Pr family membrane protein [Candidatus Saccharibacteria bacterium]|nr:Pr6Pr family membrane protein [Pseudorhodobacter sp.]